MRKLITICAVLTMVLAVSGLAQAAINDFLAARDQFGYQGTVSNVTDSTGPWTMPTPRDAAVYFTGNVPGYGAYNGYNTILSNWSGDPAGRHTLGHPPAAGGRAMKSPTGLPSAGVAPDAVDPVHGLCHC